MRFLSAFLIVFSFTFNGLTAQERKVIELSGRIMIDSVRPASFANILIVNKFIGISTDFNGYYDILTQVNDTVVFSYLGCKKQKIVIVDPLKDHKLIRNIKMELDTIFLKKHYVKPMGDYNQFRQAVANTKIDPDPDVVQALVNFEMILKQEMLHPSPMSAYGNYRNSMEMINFRPRAGQMPYYGFLNPIAWAKYIEFVKKQKSKKKMN